MRTLRFIYLYFLYLIYTNIPTIAKLIIKNIITGIYPVFGNTLFATVVSFFVLFDVIVVVSSSFFCFYFR